MNSTTCRALALLAVLTLPALLRAQQPPSTVPSLPPIGLPLPPIGLPPAPLWPPPVDPGPKHAITSPREQSRPLGRARSDRKSHPPAPLVVFVPGPVTWGAAWDDRSEGKDDVTRAPAHEDRKRTGWLRVQTEPANAQLFVDGVYVGTSRDAGEIELKAGIYELELRARGYEPAWLQVAIPAGRGVTYRGELQIVPAKADMAATPAGEPSRRTIYVLKGCYVGDVPPPPSLPAHCDLRQMVTYPAGDSSAPR